MNMDPSQKGAGSARTGGRISKTSLKLKDSVHGGALDVALASPVAGAGFSGKAKDTPGKAYKKDGFIRGIIKERST